MNVPVETEVVVVAPATRIDRLFRDRRTGRITVVQVPNGPLLCFMGVVAVRRLGRPSGLAAVWLDAVAGLTLGTWAVGELLQGVNPWRRILGGTTLAAAGAAVLVVVRRQGGPPATAQPPPTDVASSDAMRRTSRPAGSVVTDAHP